jgi:O-antigen/teichoic acid export membrane protein
MTASSDTHVLHTARGVGFLGTGSLYGYAVSFVTSLLLARVLGAQGLGVYALGLTTASLVASLSALGLDDAMVRYLAIQRRAGDDAGVAGTLQLGIGLSTSVGLLGGLGLLALATPVAVGVFDEPDLIPVLRAFGVIVPFMTLSNALVGAARGCKRMGVAALGEEVVQTTVRLGLIAVLAVGGFEPVAAAIVFGVGDLASTVAMVVLLDREALLRDACRRGARRDVREIVTFAFPLWLAGALRKFRHNIETLLLGTLTAVASVGIYTIASKVGLVGHAVYRAIIVSVKPNLAELHGAGDRDGLERLYRTATRWALISNIPFFLVMTIFAHPLLGIFGASFAAGSTALAIIAAGELVNAGTGVCGSVLDMTRHTGAKLVNSVVWLVLVVGTNLLLIPRWGVIGAATATALAQSTVNVLRIGQVWYLERVQPYDRTFVKPLAAGVLAAAVGIGLVGLWPDPHLVVLALEIGTVVGVYVGALGLLGVADEDRMVLGAVWRRGRRAGVSVGRTLRLVRSSSPAE